MDDCKYSGILSSGYGIISKAVMKDTRISYGAKAVYSYLCAYAGSDGSAFPSVGLMCHELGISEATIKKYRKQLVDAGYISVKKRRINGKQASNLYVIEMQPCNFQPPKIQPAEKQGAEIQGAENEPPTINNSTINNLTRNNYEDTPTAKKPTKYKHGEYQNVLLTDEDMDKLKAEFPNDWQLRVERLSEYMASTGKSYRNHLATIRNWARREKPKDKNYDKPDFSIYDQGPVEVIHV